MTNIVSQVRKALSPIKTTSRALGLFSKALDALAEVRQNQQKRFSENQNEIDHNVDIIIGLTEKNELLHDDSANAILEIESADKAEKAIRSIITV